MVKSVFYTLGEFVDVLIEGEWHEGVVQGRQYGKRGTEYIVCLVNKAKQVTILFRNVRPAKRFKEMLEMEFSQEMPDPSQDNQPTGGVSQEPWKDGADFVNPVPMVAPKPKRFRKLEESDLNKLQHGAKAKSTHKATKWGLNVFKGKGLKLLSLFVCFSLIPCIFANIIFSPNFLSGLIFTSYTLFQNG